MRWCSTSLFVLTSTKIGRSLGRAPGRWTPATTASATRLLSKIVPAYSTRTRISLEPTPFKVEWTWIVTYNPNHRSTALRILAFL